MLLGHLPNVCLPFRRVEQGELCKKAGLTPVHDGVAVRVGKQQHGGFHQQDCMLLVPVSDAGRMQPEHGLDLRGS